MIGECSVCRTYNGTNGPCPTCENIKNIAAETAAKVTHQEVRKKKIFNLVILAIAVVAIIVVMFCYTPVKRVLANMPQKIHTEKMYGKDTETFIRIKGEKISVRTGTCMISDWNDTVRIPEELGKRIKKGNSISANLVDLQGYERAVITFTVKKVVLRASSSKFPRFCILNVENPADMTPHRGEYLAGELHIR